MTTLATWPSTIERADVAVTNALNEWPPDKVINVDTLVLREAQEIVEEPEPTPPPEALILRQPATPPRFAVGTLLDIRLRLRVPAKVKVTKEAESYIANAIDFEEFGYGDDPMAAVDDLRQTLAELYWTLKEEQNRLAPHLSELWNRLQKVIEER